MLPEPSGSPPEDRQPIMEEATPERSEGSQQASQRVPQDDGQTVKAETKSTTPEVEREAPVLCRSGRAIFKHHRILIRALKAARFAGSKSR